MAPIDVADASGMNLMDVLSRKWVDSILDITGGEELRGKLKWEPVEGGTALGAIHPYWTRRWGFPQGAHTVLDSQFTAFETP
jgi:xylulokinase